MKKRTFLLIAASAGFFGGCAATVPNELVNAREAYRRASMGPAAQAAPVELHAADQALVQAEQSFSKNHDTYRTRDLAYVAQRKSEIAEATASIATEQNNQAEANSDYQATQGKIVAKTKQDLRQTRTALAASHRELAASDTALAASERSGEKTAAQLSAEQDARAAAEQRATDAQAALAKLGAVKNEPRGVVITLSGSVLFASNQSALLLGAQSRLDEVADVLLTTSATSSSRDCAPSNRAD